MTSALNGPVVYPPWDGAEHGDQVVQGTRGVTLVMGTVTRSWTTDGSAFTYDDGSGAGEAVVEIQPDGPATTAAGTESVMRVRALSHLGLSLVRAVDLAKIGDEVRDLDAALALPVGTLLGASGVPTAVVTGDDTARTLVDLATGAAIPDLYDYLAVVYLAMRPTS